MSLQSADKYSMFRQIFPARSLTFFLTWVTALLVLSCFDLGSPPLSDVNIRINTLK